MQRINEDINSGQLQHIYLLCGAEAYLRRQYRDRLRAALVGEDTMNCHSFEGKDVPVGEIIDLAQTLPFLAERRVLFIENSGLFKRGGEELAQYLAQLPDTSYFVFTEPEVDKRSKLYKAVQKNGWVEEFPVQEETTLKRWILGILKRENKKITEQALGLFLDKTGTEMDNIRMELEKLLCYCMDREAVTAEDIEKVCTQRIASRIFDMVNAIADRRQREALSLYYDLLALKEPAMRILFLISRQFNLLLQVKELKNKGYDNRKIGEKIGLPGFIAGKYAAQAAKFKRQELLSSVADCVEAEEAVKTGRMNDVMSVEMLIVRCSGQNARVFMTQGGQAAGRAAQP